MIFDDIPYEYPVKRRVIIIGDIHGDIKRLKTILIDASVINRDLEWIAEPPDTFIVQVGDQIDSANRMPDIKEWEVIDDISVIHFMNSIDNIARAKGGRVISLIGNHELMNTMGNFSYVSKNSNISYREKYFAPGGSLSPILSKRPIVLKIGPLFFCHAGVKKDQLDILDKYEKDVSYLNDVWRHYILNNKLDQTETDIFNKIILDDNGILWTRELDSENDMQYVLDKLKCSFIFVGHNTVDSIKLYQNKIWFTDNGISRAYSFKQYQYIDINDFKISVKTINDE